MYTDQQIIDQIIAEIREDVAAGRVPSTVQDFGELHEYIDANMYADHMVAVRELAGEEWNEFMNVIQTKVSDMIKSGALL